jgi:GNAT superfamily N-acetyltransferase
VIATRRLTVADWQANRAIRIEAVAANPGLYFATLAELHARSDDAWRAMLENSDLAIFGLYDADLLVGLTAAYLDRDHDPTGRTAGLAMSYIRPGWRGRGLTALLYAPRLAWARERGCTHIHVTHRASNIPSMRAIRRHGFILTGKELHLWPDGEEEENFRYELALA